MAGKGPWSNRQRSGTSDVVSGISNRAAFTVIERAAAALSQELRKAVQTYQEQLRQAELTQYSLTLHLRQAMQHTSMPGQKHPDVL